jgi:BRCA1/BRCA2-containing complex subunit 3
MAMAVERVEISSEVYFVCLAHALATEQEEVMGLLLGDVVGGVSRVWSVSLLVRSDKRKDRVEISPEQLTSAAQRAE